MAVLHIENKEEQRGLWCYETDEFNSDAESKDI